MAVMIGWAMFQLSRRSWVKVVWVVYPLWITFVVVVTGNHDLADVVLGIFTAVVAAVVARAAARSRAHVWASRLPSGAT